jgi:serine/threonine protein kinase
MFKRLPEEDQVRRAEVIDLLHGILEIDPIKRLSAAAARSHLVFKLQLESSGR